jgi:RimJ/RimL family protein N-acetyltransferase
MNVILETDRLFLRTFTSDDSGLIYNLNLDPYVTRYTHDPVRDIYHAKEILDQVIIPQYVLYNYGRWAVHIKPMLTFIGWCGLKYRPEKVKLIWATESKKNIGVRPMLLKQLLLVSGMDLKNLVYGE